MIVVQSADDLREAVARASDPIGFVPTMGALHQGHASLFDAARQVNRTVVASIFVNALQFENTDDLAKYPRTLDADLDICRAAGVDIVYAPTNEAMYPVGFETVVSVGRLGRILEGSDRPGHFDGVATVVTKLLAACRADHAYFGQKDLQQVAVIRRIVTDLDLGTSIEMLATIRDADGLALSSRNIRLSSTGRAKALAIPRALEIARDLAQGGERRSDIIASSMIEVLKASDLQIHYATVVDADTFEDSDAVGTRSAALIAASVDGVRLIDNSFLL